MDLTIHTKYDVSGAVKALAAVAEKVSELRTELENKPELVEPLAGEVMSLAAKLFEAGMAVTKSVERFGEPDFAVKPAKSGRKIKAAKAAKKAPKKKAVAVTSAAEPAADKKARKGYAVQGTCTICGKPYLKRAPVQKTCSPECQTAKNRAYAQEHRAETSGGSGGDRLTKIKDIADKLA